MVIRYQLLLEHLGGKIVNRMKMNIRHEAFSKTLQQWKLTAWKTGESRRALSRGTKLPREAKLSRETKATRGAPNSNYNKLSIIFFPEIIFPIFNFRVFPIIVHFVVSPPNLPILIPSIHNMIYDKYR